MPSATLRNNKTWECLDCSVKPPATAPPRQPWSVTGNKKWSLEIAEDDTDLGIAHACVIVMHCVAQLGNGQAFGKDIADSLASYETIG